MSQFEAADNTIAYEERYVSLCAAAAAYGRAATAYRGYDSATDGSVSRWSFHIACMDPTAPANARCRKNVVVRSFVFI
jgi:hypothetical protein